MRRKRGMVAADGKSAKSQVGGGTLSLSLFIFIFIKVGNTRIWMKIKMKRERESISPTLFAYFRFRGCDDENLFHDLAGFDVGLERGVEIVRMVAGNEGGVGRREVLPAGPQAMDED